MIVYVPDPCSVAGKLVVFSRPRLDFSVAQKHVLVDVGVAIARGGYFSVSDYIRLIRKVKAVRHVEEVAAVVPDVVNNYSKTVENYRKYARYVRGAGAKTVFVAQELKPPPHDVDADIVAVPSHWLLGVNCAREPETCAFRILRFLREHSERVHLLGPPKRLLKLLLRSLGGNISFDTTAYRMAPNESSRKLLGGKYMAEGGVACQWLSEWLKELNLGTWP